MFISSLKLRRSNLAVSSIEKKREKEQVVVAKMIALYCKKNHARQDELCESCSELLAYAQTRSERCPFMENKTFCSNCKVHCYNTEMREKIRDVMRFSGPRMIFHYPHLAFWHLICSMQEKKRLNSR